MDTFRIVRNVFFAVLFLAMFIISIVSARRARRKYAELPKMTAEELRALAKKQPILYGRRVIEELKSRNEDFSFAFIVYLKLAVERNPASQIIGWAGLKHYFADQLPNFNFTKNKPSPEERSLIQSTLEKMDKLINGGAT